MNKNTFKLTDAAIPPEVERIATKYGKVIVCKRFEARNWRKAVKHGFAIETDRGVLLVEDDCTLVQGGGMVNAWGVSFVGDGKLDDAVSGMYCHTIIKVSFFGHNIAKGGK